jgi:hypothetical protein
LAAIGYDQPHRLAIASPAHPASQPEEVADLRAEVLELTKRAAEAEGESRVLRQALEHERAKADRLEADLRQLNAELRRPWWRKLLG